MEGRSDYLHLSTAAEIGFKYVAMRTQRKFPIVGDHGSANCVNDNLAMLILQLTSKVAVMLQEDC